MLIIFLAMMAGVLSGIKFFPFKSENISRIKINNQVIFVEIADTPEKITQGLSDRTSLAENQGMLFVLNKSGFHTFWMNQMKFSLDFVFINNNQVVDLIENVSFPKEGEQPQTLTAKSPFDKVLEINAGKIKEYGIMIGQAVEFP